MDECAKIFNKHIDWAIANHSYNKNKAHKELYHLLRVEHSCVPSALVQTKCNVCKHIKKTNRHKSRFHCKNCGHRTHADLNAANNIRDSYILSSTQQGTEEQASVNVPYVRADSFS